MNNKQRNIVILVILCVLLLMIGLFFYIDLSLDDNSDNLIINNSDNEELFDDDINDDNDEDIVNEQNNVKENANNSECNDCISEDNTDKYVDNQIYIDDNNDYNEKDVVNYFESMEYEVENSTSFKEKFKEYFITIVDFIFYEGKIKGHTFDELTGTAKAKIIAVALKIDAKIDEYIPGYKESISSTTGKVYTDIKEKLVTSYMDISSSICKENEKECDKVKDIFSDVKEYCKIGWDFVKGLFKNGATKIKDWYEIYSGK